MEVAAAPRVVVFGASSLDDLPGVGAVAADARFHFASNGEELARVVSGADVILGWDFRAGILERVWPQAERLQWVHWAGAGVDAVLFPAFRDSDVVLTNARGVFDQPIAEYVLGLVLCFAKDFPRTVRAQERKSWDFRYSESIQGRTALLVGVGSIGRAIGALLHGAGMEVTGIGRTGRSGDPLFGEIHGFDALDRKLGGADYVINVTPSTPETRGLFSVDRFQAMKAGARFINVGRGDAVDEEALAESLRRGRLGGAALDVFAEEPLPAESPLWELDNVIVSPHMSGDVSESTEHLVAQFVNNLRRFIRDEPLDNVVDKRRGY
ncbi:MAG: D-2-hydroxyacid dehydrogenase [Gammaproteobacteria bacterium]|nr:D-2-hydroxyacid dehydrogenase [Gammaproteobacteria bacterium]